LVLFYFLITAYYSVLVNNSAHGPAGCDESLC
jgi:hypothetical protein